MHRPLLRRAGFALGLALLSPPAFGQLAPGAQQPAQTPPAGETAPATEPGATAEPAGNAPATPVVPGAPGAGGPPVQGGPLGNLAPGVGAPAVGNGAAAPEDPGAAGPSEGPQLPEDYQPPSSPPAIITKVPDPRRTDKEMQEAEKKLKELSGNRGVPTLLMQGVPSGDYKEALAGWAQLQVDKMTAADSIREISNVGSNIAQRVWSAASQQSNPNRQREFREALAEALTKELQDVLLNNNLYVRLQAAALLGNLNLTEPSARGDQPAVAYTPAMAALLDALEDVEEDTANNPPLQAVKIVAAQGIRRLALDSPTMDVELRYRAGDVMTKELAKPDTHFWYQMVLAEALASIGMDVNRARDPIVITALMSVISDPQRHCAARAAAAKALSRTPLPAGQFDEEAAAAAILAMGREFAVEYNKSPQLRKWPFCFHDLSLAFQLGEEEESAKLSEDGLLRKGTLPAAYQTVQQRLQPVINHVLSQGPNPESPAPIPNELLQPLNQELPGTAAASTE